MSANNASNPANGPVVISPKPNPNIIDRARRFVTDTVNLILRFYFGILLLIYFWLVKIVTRALQPLEPILKQMYKVPAEDVSAEGIRNQLTRLLCTVLLLLAPLVNQIIVFVTRPLIWARNKIIEYVEEGEKDALRQTNPKDS
ncbi:unnamed protein product [Candidula unifasciata]|uniref:Uncharacterized protein n=1 Tax=Candidula unifasciata TaxID=100452 RepID=A0A8S4A2H8_9EUPU|nr:unnamed protein product [Candidula unifasciata]